MIPSKRHVVNMKPAITNSVVLLVVDIYIMYINMLVLNIYIMDYNLYMLYSIIYILKNHKYFSIIQFD